MATFILGWYYQSMNEATSDAERLGLRRACADAYTRAVRMARPQHLKLGITSLPEHERPCG